jgi:hypothetical protein
VLKNSGIPIFGKLDSDLEIFENKKIPTGISGIRIESGIPPSDWGQKNQNQFLEFPIKPMPVPPGCAMRGL